MPLLCWLPYLKCAIADEHYTQAQALSYFLAESLEAAARNDYRPAVLISLEAFHHQPLQPSNKTKHVRAIGQWPPALRRSETAASSVDASRFVTLLVKLCQGAALAGCLA